MHLVIDDKLGEKVKKEVERRNALLKAGERKHTINSVSNEILVFWFKNKSK